MQLDRASPGLIAIVQKKAKKTAALPGFTDNAAVFLSFL